MNLKAKIGQMIVVRASGYLFDEQRRYPQWEADNQTLRQWLQKLNLGGVILLGGSAVELQTRSQQLQSWARQPLLIAADIEEGVGQRFSGLTWFPPPMALNAIADKNLKLAQNYAREMGAITAQEAMAIGVNWLLAPVVDVNNNPNNPVINIRAFSDRPEVVEALTTAFIQGAQQYPILTTAKHFPGHGDTAIDSHLDLPVINHDESRLQQVELAPFKSAIASGVNSVMTAHLTIPAWDPKHPATLSQTILTDKLRQELGFDGLIVTDALIMGGITKYASGEEVAVMAVEAGVDVLLMPNDPLVTIEAIYQAVRSGRITEARIEQSYQRILTAKNQVKDCKTKEWVDQQATTSNKIAITARILQDSLQSGGELPLKVSQKIEDCSLRNLIVVDDILNSNFLDLPNSAIAIPQRLGLQRQLLDRNSLELITQDRRLTLLQLFVRGNPFRGTAGLTNEAIEQYQKLIESDRLIGLIIYGSPYVLQWFLELIPPNLPWVFTYGQMELSQAISLKTLLDSPSSVNNLLIKNPDNFGF